MKLFWSILLTGMVVSAAMAEDYSDRFIPGEVAEYKISWMTLPLAWSKISTDTVNENGRELIRIRMVSQSYKAYAHIYKVDNATEVIIDPDTALPIRLDFKQDEGGRKRSYLTVFHHDKQIAIFRDRITKDIKIVPIHPETRDILSFIYSERNKPLTDLSEETHVLYVGGKLYSLGLEVRDDEKIRLPDYGKVPCTEVLPIAEFDGWFLRKGKVFFWVSKGKHPMITCIKAKVAVGKISIKLQEASGTGDRFWDKEK